MGSRRVEEGAIEGVFRGEETGCLEGRGMEG